MRIVRMLVLAVVIVLSAGCGDNPRGLAALRDIESYIEHSPDSALTALRNLDSSILDTRHLRARHALLHSIALDKNYIDLTTDSVIAPAVSYFSRKGSPDDRFKSFYYLGRIHQNAGRDEEAMELFVKATSFEDKVTDKAALARCWSAMGMIYSYLYDFDRAIESFVKSSSLFLEIGNINSYVNDCLKIADSWWCLGEYANALPYIKMTEPYLYLVGNKALGRYYSERLSVERESSAEGVTSETIREYLSVVPDSIIDWLVVSNTYFFLKQPEQALQALEMYQKFNTDFNNEGSYHAMASKIYEAIGEYKKSLYHNNRYSYLTDSLDMVILSEDTKFIQERHQKDMDILKNRNKALAATVVIILLCLILSASAFWAIRQDREKKTMTCLFETAVREKDALSEMLRNMPVNDPQIISLLSDRLDLLNDIVLHHRIPNSKKRNSANDKIQTLASDSKEYLATISMSFMMRDPSFVSFLKSKELSTWEIGYCCLYIMGYSAKEISGIMNNSQVYKISSEIRRKLGYDDGKVRLETILKTIYAEMKS